MDEMEHRCFGDMRLNFLSVLSTTAANPITKAEYAIKTGKARDFTLERRNYHDECKDNQRKHGDDRCLLFPPMMIWMSLSVMGGEAFRPSVN
jgi:hypothetical protein